jgi:succinate-acetate transporter protein
MAKKEVKASNVCVAAAEPAALGLFGLAMVTLVASTQKLGMTTGLSFVVPWAIFLGSFAQLFAAVADSKRNNMFGATAFGAYGLFWLGVAFSWMTKMGIFGADLMNAVDNKQLGVAFIGYLVFSLYMTVASLETNKVFMAIFVLIDFLFIGLILHSFGYAVELSATFAGISEIMIAIVSFYGSAAFLLNGHLNRTLLPLGKPLGLLKR